MAYPTDYDELSADKINATRQRDIHPLHHDALAQAVNALQHAVGLEPGNGYPTVSAAIADLLLVAGFTDLGATAIKPQPGDGVSFVSVNGDDAWDGLSWGSAYRSIQKAHDEAGGGATIFVGNGEYVEEVGITKDGLHLIGVGMPDAPLNSETRIKATGNAADIVTVDGADDVKIENIHTRGNSTSWNGTAWSLSHSNYSVLRDCGHRNQDGTATSSTGGTGFHIDNSEGWLLEKMRMMETSLSYDISTEAAQGTCINISGASNYRDLLVSGTTAGALFLNAKFVNAKTATPNMIELASNTANCLFLWLDADEGHVGNKILIAGDRHTFINCAVSPESIMNVEGDDNTFLHTKVLGQLIATVGTRNKFEAPYIPSAGLLHLGTGNIIDREINAGGTVTLDSGVKRYTMTTL